MVLLYQFCAKALYVCLLYALVKGYEVNLRRVVEDSIFEFVKLNFAGNILHPSLITLLCIKGAVKFNEEEEERCPKTSPLTLTGFFKASVESGEKEREEIEVYKEEKEGRG